MKGLRIPFNRPSLQGGEWDNLKTALRLGQLSGDGFFTKQTQLALKKILKAPEVLLTSSCTHALELAALLIDLKPKDEVILPSFTFPSTANAFVLRGAIPRFIDIHPSTLNLDETQLPSLVRKKTKAICVVHYGGVPCEMTPIMQFAKKHSLFLIEDAAQALGAEYKGRKMGSFGDLAAISFHETKNVNCGEGGALVINKTHFIHRAEIIRQKGTNRAAFYRGEVDKYSWVDIGSSYVPSELQAAYLFAQIRKEKEIRKKREEIFNAYYRGLKFLESQGKCKLPIIPKSMRSSYHLFFLILESEKMQIKLLRYLSERGIKATSHYVPLHLSKMGKSFGYKKGDLPVTEDISSKLIRLPFFNSMKRNEIDYIIKTINLFFR